MVKTLLAISAAVLILALLSFRFHADSGLRELERCPTAVGQARRWTIETTALYSPNLVTSTTRYKVNCPDDYEYVYRTRTTNDVITEKSDIHTNGVSYVETVDGRWEKTATVSNPQIPMECGKGPALVQSTV